MAIELVPLCTARLTLKLPPLVLEGTPVGTRTLIEMTDVVYTGERLSGRLAGPAALDWLVESADGVAAIDVQFVLQTSDGAYVHVSYRGRSDHRHGPGGAPLYTAPLFQTGDPRYAWLNTVQAIGKAELVDGNVLAYEIYEVR